MTYQRKSRARPGAGPRPDCRRLTPAQVLRLRLRRHDGAGVRELARLLGMSHGAVGDVCRGYTYKDLPTDRAAVVVALRRIERET